MGPAGAPNVTLDKLLSPDPKLEKDLETIMKASKAAKLPFRMSEGNSCWNGGQQGVSDTLASALWVADVMLQFAAAGCVGVNMHGGGNGYYTPIAGSLGKGFSKRPEYFGMQLAEKFSGATMLTTVVQCESDRVRAYAAERSGAFQIALINKTNQRVQISMEFPHAVGKKRPEVWVLTGPAMERADGVAFQKAEAANGKSATLEVGPHSATLWKYQS